MADEPPDLPLILAGPIVRRVVVGAASVWIAFGEAASVTVKIWSQRQIAATEIGEIEPGLGDPPAMDATAQTVSFGARLHVALVTVVDPGLTQGGLYSYDVVFDDVGGTQHNLRSQGLLVNEQAGARRSGVHADAPLHLALGYGDNWLPSFRVPPQELKLVRLAHGSCRNTNAPEWDAMAFLDDYIAEDVKFENRPQQLFLTGDQIYADDVAAPLLPMLSALSVDLLGGTEYVPLKKDSDGGNPVLLDTTDMLAMRRQRLVRAHASFTSLESDNHLLGFGEFAAMYLAVWGNGVWRRIADDADDIFVAIPGNVPEGVLTDWEKCRGSLVKWREHDTALLNEQAEYLKLFREAVPKVARVLANVATYMIFDDHEVTDDWNLNKQWFRRVNENDQRPLGKAIVRNAMLAYAVFQGQGNDPAAFKTEGLEPGANADILFAGAKLFDGSGGPFPRETDDDRADWLDKRFGLTPGESLVAWHYRISFTAHSVAVLDSRTRRKWGGEQAAPPPSLLGDSLDSQVPPVPPQIAEDNTKLLFVVSPAPVLEAGAFARLGRPITEVVWDVKAAWHYAFDEKLDPCFEVPRVNSAEKYDAEGWGGDEPARESLLTRLAGYGTCVILSGDVHCATSLVLDHWRGAPAVNARIVQITSSPLRNIFKPVVSAIVRSDALLQRYIEAGKEPVQLAWNSKEEIDLHGASVPPSRRARMAREPVLVSARDWPAGTTANPPAWAWRLSLVRDERSDADRPSPPPALDPPPETPTPLDTYRRVARRHAAAAAKNFDHRRQIVFASNVSVISIDASSGGFELTNRLLSKSEVDPKKAPTGTRAPSTLHTIWLTPLPPTQMPELETLPPEPDDG